MERIQLIQGDITKLEVEAIVNAANSSLLGGGGVDGAIHGAAGKELLKACKLLNGCPVGEAKITLGYKLPAQYVIHTVGPYWKGGKRNEPRLLADAYRNSLQLAVVNGIKEVAFPNISTGVYNYPKRGAAEIAIKTAKDFLEQHPELEKVIFVCFDKVNYNYYNNILYGVPFPE